MDDQRFSEGQLIIYKPRYSDTCEIGRITLLCEDGAFVCYHSGETAAKTNYEDMLPISNDQYIVGITLGGQ